MAQCKKNTFSELCPTLYYINASRATSIALCECVSGARIEVYRNMQGRGNDGRGRRTAMMESAAAAAAAAAATQAHIVSLLCVFILRVPTPSCFPLSLCLQSHTSRKYCRVQTCQKRRRLGCMIPRLAATTSSRNLAFAFLSSPYKARVLKLKST